MSTVIDNAGTDLELVRVSCGCEVYTKSMTGATRQQCPTAQELTDELLAGVDHADETGDWSAAKAADQALSKHYGG